MLKALLLILVLCCLATVCVLIGAHLNPHPLASNAIADRILVEKAARRLTLLRDGMPLKTYRVALGRAPFAEERKSQIPGSKPQTITKAQESKSKGA